MNHFQLLAIFVKSFFHLRCLTGFWIRLWWLQHLPLMTATLDNYSTRLWWLNRSSFLPKTYLPFSYTPYFGQYSIDFWINMTWNKYKWTQNFENVHNFIKCTLQCIYNMSQYEIYSPGPSNQTAQRNAELHNFLCVLVSLNRRKIKFTSSSK